MGVEVKWTLDSLSDIESIAEFIARDSPYYASVQVNLFFDRAEALIDFPQSGRIVPEVGQPEIGELIEGSYRVIYRIVSDSRIDILTGHHSSRELMRKKLVK